MLIISGLPCFSTTVLTSSQHHSEVIEFYRLHTIIFHRVIDDFKIQDGDSTGTGNSGPGYSIDDEFAPNLSHVQKTHTSMINSHLLNYKE